MTIRETILKVCSYCSDVKVVVNVKSIFFGLFELFLIKFTIRRYKKVDRANNPEKVAVYVVIPRRISLNKCPCLASKLYLPAMELASIR